MRNAIKEFICLSTDEKKQIWINAVFVFDTNVLLDLYRYSKSTREMLIEAISSLKEKVYLPYHIAYEFMNNRFEVIIESEMKYSNLEKETNVYLEKLKATLRLEDDDADLNNLNQFILNWLQERETNDLAVTHPQDDSILDIILDIFDNKIGNKYTDEEYKLMCDEGKSRYENEVPPGYEDIKKPDNKYGDYIIWTDILKFSKENKSDIIFVTRDLKEDWWLSIKGRKICPHIELNREFINFTGQRFYMYNVKSFLEQFNNEHDSEKEKAISEIEKIAVENESQNHFFRYRATPEYRIQQADAKINYIQEKIRREENYIATLINKYPLEPRPDDIQALIENTQIKMQSYKADLNYWLSKLEYLQKEQ